MEPAERPFRHRARPWGEAVESGTGMASALVEYQPRAWQREKARGPQRVRCSAKGRRPVTGLRALRSASSSSASPKRNDSPASSMIRSPTTTPTTSLRSSRMTGAPLRPGD